MAAETEAEKLKKQKKLREQLERELEKVRNQGKKPAKGGVTGFENVFKK